MSEIETAEELVIPIMEAIAKTGRLRHGIMDHDTHVEEIAGIIKARDAAVRRAALEAKPEDWAELSEAEVDAITNYPALLEEVERLRGALKKCERMWRRAPTDTELARLNPNNECAWQLKLLDEVSAVARAALEGK